MKGVSKIQVNFPIFAYFSIMWLAASCSSREKTLATYFCKMTHIFTLYAKVVEKLHTNLPKMVHFFPLYAKLVEKRDKNRGKLTSHFWSLFFPYMQKVAKKLTKIPKKWPEFFPYMQKVGKFVTRIGKKWMSINLLKWRNIFPLYADWPKKRNTFHPFLTTFFPLYAECPRFHDQNHPFWWPPSWPYFDPGISLICGKAPKTLPKSTCFDQIFYHICESGWNFLTIFT